MLGAQRLQFAVRVRKFAQRLAGVRVAVEKRELPLQRQKRLVIVRPVQIDQFVAEFLENAQRGGGSVDELPVRPGCGKAPPYNQVAIDALDSRFVEEGIEFLQCLPGENRFDGAGFRAGPDQRLVGSFAEEQLERADDDRFTRTGFARDRSESRRQLPFEVFHERQVFDSQEAEGGGHFGEAVES